MLKIDNSLQRYQIVQDEKITCVQDCGVAISNISKVRSKSPMCHTECRDCSCFLLFGQRRINCGHRRTWCWTASLHWFQLLQDDRNHTCTTICPWLFQVVCWAVSNLQSLDYRPKVAPVRPIWCTQVVPAVFVEALMLFLERLNVNIC